MVKTTKLVFVVMLFQVFFSFIESLPNTETPSVIGYAKIGKARLGVY